MKMKEKMNEKNLDELNAGISKLREEFAVLAAGFKKPAGRKIDRSSVDEEQPQEGPVNGDQYHGGWTGFRHRLDEAGARGERVAKGLADEIERHPLMGGMAAFGLGFMIARILFKRRKKDPRQ